eukprot:11073998-Ditylum_brightwellii.AAC.1
MKGETVMRIVRAHKRPGADDPPYNNVRWAMDNWFTSKPMFDILVCLEQYPYGIMERKLYVPPFVTFGPTKRPT